MENIMQDRVETLKLRTKHCKCKYCGGELELRKIIYGELENARVEIFCSQCDRIEYGVENEIYDISKYFVEEMDFNAYPDLDSSEITKQMSIAKTCEIIAWGCINLGLMDESGFKYPIKKNVGILGEALIVDNDELMALQGIQH